MPHGVTHLCGNTIICLYGYGRKGSNWLRDIQHQRIYP